MSSFSIKSVVVGPVDVNCYILKDKATGKGAVIDPGGHVERIMSLINDMKADIAEIIITHGHFDHIGALDELRNAVGCGASIHELDAEMLLKSRKNLSIFMGTDASFRPAERLLKDGDVIRFGESFLKVIHTPGHTAGGICLYDGDKVLFSGDTLFAGSVGRSDFPGGDHYQLIESVVKALAEVKDETVVYPGHGPETGMGYERKNNPFLG